MSIRSRLDRASTTFGVSRISRNSSTSLSRRFTVRLLVAPWRPWAATKRSKVLRSDRSRGIGFPRRSAPYPPPPPRPWWRRPACRRSPCRRRGGSGGAGTGGAFPIAETDDHVVSAGSGARRPAPSSSSTSSTSAGIAGEGGDDLLQPFLDAAGDPDLPLPGEEVHRAHLAHVHPHRIGGAPELRVQGGERRGRLFGRVLVGVDLSVSIISRSSASGATSCTVMPMSLIMLTMSSICSVSTMPSGR